MVSKHLQRAKAFFFANGAALASERVSDEGTHYYSDSELALIKRHREAASEAARIAVEKAGVTVDPRIVAARAKRRAKKPETEPV